MRFCHLVAISLVVVLICIQATPQGLSQTEPGVGRASPDTKASVYIYRYKEEASGNLPVFCDDVQLAELDNGRYFVVKLDVGRHAFRSSDKQSGIELDLKADQERYVRVTKQAFQSPTFIYGSNGRVVLVAPEQGRYEVQKLRPIDRRKIKDTRIVVPPEPASP